MANSNLTGEFLSNVYSTFLHLTGTVSNTNYQSVYDGVGNITTLKLTTTGVSVDNLRVKTSQFTFADKPPSTTALNMLVYVSGTSAVEARTINSVLSTTNNIVNGTYSSPTITVSGGVITSLSSNSISRFIRATSSILLSSEAVPTSNQYAASATAYFKTVSATDQTLSPAFGDVLYYVHNFTSVIPIGTVPTSISIIRQTYHVKWYYINAWSTVPEITPI